MADGRSITARQWVSLSLLIATLIAAVVLGYLVFSASVDKNAANWGKLFIFALGVLAAVATVIANWTAPKGERWTGIASPDKAAIALIAVFAAFGAMTDALSLLSPRQAVESNPGIIENLSVDTNEKVDALTKLLRERFPGDPPILHQISGHWGDLKPACDVVYDVSIVARGGNPALVAQTIKTPSSQKPYRLVAEIIRATEDTLYVEGVEPDTALGAAARFVYNPNTKRLSWDDRSRGSGGVEVYQPC